MVCACIRAWCVDVHPSMRAGGRAAHLEVVAHRPRLAADLRQHLLLLGGRGQAPAVGRCGAVGSSMERGLCVCVPGGQDGQTVTRRRAQPAAVRGRQWAAWVSTYPSNIL